VVVFATLESLVYCGCVTCNAIALAQQRVFDLSKTTNYYISISMSDCCFLSQVFRGHEVPYSVAYDGGKESVWP